MDNGLNASTWAPGPSSSASSTPPKKKRVRTKGPKPAPVSIVEAIASRPPTLPRSPPSASVMPALVNLTSSHPKCDNKASDADLGASMWAPSSSSVVSTPVKKKKRVRVRTKGAKPAATTTLPTPSIKPATRILPVPH
ncbi:hypothetical protein DXG01_002677 [Tephrocybe rancida]|nr:hypothetical protein DXG01_002677 [Tephrocybe rancida]